MNKIHSCICICAFLAAVQLVYGRKCTDGEMVQRNQGKKATCVKCECKGGGLHFDTRHQRKLGKKGYLECYPCAECPVGTYRKMNNAPTCYICRMNCTEQNRYEYRKCGGDSEGSCGNCLPGYKPRTDLPGDHCKKVETTPEVTAKATTNRKLTNPILNTTVTGPTSVTELGKPLENYDADLSKRGNSTQIVTPIIFSIVGLVAVAGEIGMVVACFWKLSICKCGNDIRNERKQRGEYQAQQQDDRYTALWAGTGSSLNTQGNEPDRNGGPLTSASTLTFTGESADIETDAEPVYHARSWPEGLHRVVLSGSNEYITYVATEIGNFSVNLFGLYLKIPKGVYEPERELWLQRRQEHSEYVFNVLKKWQQRNGPDATLAKLVSGLRKADIFDIAQGVVDMYTRDQSGSRAILEQDLTGAVV